MPSPRNSVLATALLLIGGAAPVAMAQETPAPAPAASSGYEIVRLGDNQMSCEALVGEINRINAEVSTSQTVNTAAINAAANGVNRNARSGATTRMAATALGGVAPALGAMAVQAQAASMISQQARMTEDIQKSVAASAAMAPLRQRADHLTKVSVAKGC